MNELALRSIELCAGVGMLGEGLRAGLGHLGIETRAVCYVEREAHAASILAARIEEGSLDPAPVWSDMLTFDAQEWRGAVDCVAAGFPCQDLSLAGRRAGLDGKRSGLFFRVLDIADDCGAWLIVLENVSGIASATAAVVDEASASDYAAKPSGDGFSDVGIEDGRLLERAAARVMGELADRGWDAECITLSASDVGANHGRNRWFCIAWRVVANADHYGRKERGLPATVGRIGQTDSVWAGDELGNASCVDGNERQRQRIGEATDGRAESRAEGPVEAVEQPASIGRQERWPESAGQQGRFDAAVDGCAVADPGCFDARRREHVTGSGRLPTEHHADCAAMADARCVQRCARHEQNRFGTPEAPGHEGDDRAADCGVIVADAGGTRRQGHEFGRARACNGGGQEAHGPTSQLRSLFAPGPADPRWGAILAEHPELAPALEPTFRSVVDGLAFSMGDSRAARLKCVGNGVVALQAAAGIVELVRRARN